jgi:hypothetical protein
VESHIKSIEVSSYGVWAGFQDGQKKSRFPKAGTGDTKQKNQTTCANLLVLLRQWSRQMPVGGACISWYLQRASIRCAACIISIASGAEMAEKTKRELHDATPVSGEGGRAQRTTIFWLRKATPSALRHCTSTMPGAMSSRGISVRPAALGTERRSWPWRL